MTLDEFRALLSPLPADYAVSSRWRGILARAAAETAGMDVATLAAFGARGLFDPEGSYPELDYAVELHGALPPESFATVVEVGPGYGAFAAMLKAEDPWRRFVLVDLPDALPFCFAYLTTAFPDATVGVVTEATHPHVPPLAPADFIFCPAHLLHLVEGPVDLFVNTTSLGEMPQASVDYVMGCVEDLLRPRYLYSRNQSFIDKARHGDTGREEGNLAVLKLSRPEWIPLFFKLHFDRPDGEPRYIASAILERTNRLQLDPAKGEDYLMGHAYLVALWYPEWVDVFVDLLNTRRAADGFTDPIDGVGEVRFLRCRA